MNASENLDELFADAELSFGHPGRNFDDTPEHFDHLPITGHDPKPDYTPDEPDLVVHYAPGDRPLCGNNSMTASYSDAPYQVAGCQECLELVAEDHNDYRGRCLHCRQEITAQGGVEWRRVVRAPCPHCSRPGW